MAQPMEIPALKDLVVDDGVAPCPSHASSVEQQDQWINRILYLAPPFSLRQRRTRIHTASPALSRLVSHF